MNRYSLTHVSDPDLLRDLRSLLSRERATTAELLAHLAEVDARRLYAPAGYPSMFAWCVEELHLSEDEAFKRIRASRVARRFSVVFAMLADGRLHLTAVVLLAPCLTPENADDLLAAATHQSKAGIERLIAERFPQPDLPAWIEAPVPPLARPLPSPGTVEVDNAQLAPEPVASTDHQLAPEPVESTDRQLSPGTAGPLDAAPSLGTVWPRVAPLAPGRYGLQFTVAQATYEKLRYAQALLGHAVPSGELSEVFDRALDALIVRLEQGKFAVTDRPRPRRQRTTAHPRHIPAEVRRAVWERDGGRCTFAGESGHRCESRTRLEFDHAEPVASAGRATAGNLRLRCRAHNQCEAERRFGRDFMRARRETGGKRPLPEHAAEVIPWLRHLGMRAEEARRWAECCADMAEASLEERLRHALRCSARSSPRRAA